jgi:hypothetical protein
MHPERPASGATEPETNRQTNATNFIQFHFAGCSLPVIVRRGIGTPEKSRHYLVNKAGTL